MPFVPLPASLRSKKALATVVVPVIGVAAAVTAGLAGGTSANAAPTEVSLFAESARPAMATVSDPHSVELGVRFRASTAGTVTGIRFFKGSVRNGGTHTGSLWNAQWKRLTTVTFTNESASGWQTARFATPVAIAPDTTFIASYFAPKGFYSANNGFFTSAHVAGPLRALASTDPRGNGLFHYGASQFPSDTFQASNYWVDVLFRPAGSGGGSTTAPTVAPTRTATATATPKPSVTPTRTATATPTVKPTTPATSTPPRTQTGFPDASNTGVPKGTTLTAYTGPSVITQAGTVIDGKRVTSCLDIRANNVTIRNSLIQSKGCFFNVLSDNGNTGMTLTDVEIDGQGNTSGDSGINGGGWTCLRCNIHDTVDGVKAGNNVVIKDSFIHDLAQFNDSHNDGIQSLGTNSLRIEHNTIIVADGATSAIILSTGSADSMRNITITDNLMAGGAFTVYGGFENGSDDRSKVSNISITNNRFSTRIFPKGGAFGPLTSADSPVVVSGNTFADGPNAGQPVS